MRDLSSWLAGKAKLYALLVLAIAFSLLIWPSLGNLGEEIAGGLLDSKSIEERASAALTEAQTKLDAALKTARTAPAERLRARMKQREADLATTQEDLTELESGFAAYFYPPLMIERKQLEIEVELARTELGLLRRALAPRLSLEEAAAYLRANPTRPTARAVANLQQACDDATANREIYCNGAKEAAQRREDGLAAGRNQAAALAELEALEVKRLSQSISTEGPGVTLRDILIQALIALVLITLLPLLLRVLFYFVLAPIAERQAPMRFANEDAIASAQAGTQSQTTMTVTLMATETLLVRQDCLQTLDNTAQARTQWLLDTRHPISSLVSGMRFLTAISGAGERVTISGSSGDLMRVSDLRIPKGGSAIARPSAIAALVYDTNAPVRIAVRWRWLSLHAWLTFQFRYFEFHGPVRLILEGRHGVRIQDAKKGTKIRPYQILGFSSELAYSVIRNETFWPYLFGQQDLFKDNVEGNQGQVMLEETPADGSSGRKRGFEGAFDAALKAFGI